ncbi:collagen alpha-1(I) chain-like [Varanus komodoensis]|uniref:collagen alpha-1(I) chain-like n=1 Tax=Varanus komodoensis TaxID=61221 RepID=UPI001CF778E4|nr:collagen alpha-1(I) chain-like [Varanus komodoensis]
MACQCSRHQPLSRLVCLLAPFRGEKPLCPRAPGWRPRLRLAGLTLGAQIAPPRRKPGPSGGEASGSLLRPAGPPGSRAACSPGLLPPGRRTASAAARSAFRSAFPAPPTFPAPRPSRRVPAEPAYDLLSKAEEPAEGAELQLEIALALPENRKPQPAFFSSDSPRTVHPAEEPRHARPALEDALRPSRAPSPPPAATQGWAPPPRACPQLRGRAAGSLGRPARSAALAGIPAPPAGPCGPARSNQAPPDASSCSSHRPQKAGALAVLAGVVGAAGEALRGSQAGGAGARKADRSSGRASPGPARPNQSPRGQRPPPQTPLASLPEVTTPLKPPRPSASRRRRTGAPPQPARGDTERGQARRLAAVAAPGAAERARVAAPARIPLTSRLSPLRRLEASGTDKGASPAILANPERKSDVPKTDGAAGELPGWGRGGREERGPAGRAGPPPASERSGADRGGALLRGEEGSAAALQAGRQASAGRGRPAPSPPPLPAPGKAVSQTPHSPSRGRRSSTGDLPPGRGLPPPAACRTAELQRRSSGLPQRAADPGHGLGAPRDLSQRGAFPWGTPRLSDGCKQSGRPFGPCGLSLRAMLCSARPEQSSSASVPKPSATWQGKDAANATPHPPALSNTLTEHGVCGRPRGRPGQGRPAARRAGGGRASPERGAYWRMRRGRRRVPSAGRGAPRRSAAVVSLPFPPRRACPAAAARLPPWGSRAPPSPGGRRGASLPARQRGRARRVACAVPSRPGAGTGAPSGAAAGELEGPPEEHLGGGGSCSGPAPAPAALSHPSGCGKRRISRGAGRPEPRPGRAPPECGPPLQRGRLCVRRASYAGCPSPAGVRGCRRSPAGSGWRPLESRAGGGTVCPTFPPARGPAGQGRHAQRAPPQREGGRRRDAATGHLAPAPRPRPRKACAARRASWRNGGADGRAPRLRMGAAEAPCAKRPGRGGRAPRLASLRSGDLA